MGVELADDPRNRRPGSSRPTSGGAATPRAARPSRPLPAAKPAPAAAGEAHAPKAAAPTGPPDPPPPADAVVPAFITSLQAAVPGSVTHVSYYLGDWTVIVPAAHIAARPRQHLRDAPEAAFDYLLRPHRHRLAAARRSGST